MGEARASSTAAAEPQVAAATTVMLRNIPNRYSRSTMLTLFNHKGFRRFYNFVYLPMDFRNGVNLGYAFVNLLTNADAVSFMQAFEGHNQWCFDSAKVCEVSWAH